jgi:general secretion pathway protein D
MPGKHANMSRFNRLVVVLACSTLFGPLTPVQAQTKKGDVFMAQGRLHEAKKEWDAALESYRKAAAEDPTDPVYQVAVDKGRLQAAQTHVEKGLTIRSQGRLADSLVEFQKAYAINPGSAIASQELHDTQQMILRETKRLQETGKEAPPEEKALTPGQAAEKEETDKISRMLAVPELRPSTPGVVDLKITGKTRTIFETVAKYAGLNLLWDPNYTVPAHDLFAVDFKDATLDEALDHVALITKSNWKRLSPTVIFVTNQK